MVKKEFTIKLCILEQKTYASQEYFTHPLVVMVETFRSNIFIDVAVQLGAVQCGKVHYIRKFKRKLHFT